jgi:hypothetical protein
MTDDIKWNDMGIFDISEIKQFILKILDHKDGNLLTANFNSDNGPHELIIYMCDNYEFTLSDMKNNENQKLIMYVSKCLNVLEKKFTIPIPKHIKFLHIMQNQADNKNIRARQDTLYGDD